jgi:hypothetical protein
MPLVETKNLGRAVLSTSPQVGILNSIPEPVDPVTNTALSALKCVTYVLAHPLPMSPVQTQGEESDPSVALDQQSEAAEFTTNLLRELMQLSTSAGRVS